MNIEIGPNRLTTVSSLFTLSSSIPLARNFNQQLHQRQSFDPIFLILEEGEEETTSSILPPDPNFLDRGKDYIPARYVYVSRDERQSLSRARVRGCEARFT